MRNIIKRAGNGHLLATLAGAFAPLAIALAATTISAVATAHQAPVVQPADSPVDLTTQAGAVVNPSPATSPVAVSPAGQDADAISISPLAPAPASLDDLVAAQPADAALDGEMRCLATAIYFEAGGETHRGQLAVGRVIVARSKSGRFPSSYCGVVTQHAQFSFVHGGLLPAVQKTSRCWRESLAVARIADAGTWKSPVEGALFFHAARISPAWHVQRVARVDNQIFYR